MTNKKKNVHVDLGYVEVIVNSAFNGNLKAKLKIHDSYKVGRKQQVAYFLDLEPGQLDELTKACHEAKEKLLAEVEKHVGCIGSEFKEKAND
jgi:hypothetical protein